MSDKDTLGEDLHDKKTLKQKTSYVDKTKSDDENCTEETCGEVGDEQFKNNQTMYHERRKEKEEEKPSQISAVTLDEPPRIVTRLEWGAEEPRKGFRETMGRPIQVIGLTQCVTAKVCKTFEECCEMCRQIQKYDFDRGLPDIAYSFLVGEDGNLYEGRGWDIKPHRAIVDADLKDKAIDIAYIGDYRELELPQSMFDNILKLIRIGYEKEIVIENYEYKGYIERKY